MDSLTGIDLDELIARAKFEEGPVIISLPGNPKLSEADVRALCAKIKAQKDAKDKAPSPDLDAVDAALRNFSRGPSPATESSFVTPPPPTYEEARVMNRELEEESCKALLDDSVPLCYPPGLDLFSENVAENYEVISYWWSQGGPKDLAITSQLLDWKKFRNYQKRVRGYHVKRGTFSIFIDKVRERRQRHGLESDVRLLPDPDQQTWLENWIEFHNYHLEHYEYKQREVEEEKERLEAMEEEQEEPVITEIDGLPPELIPTRGSFLRGCERLAREESKMVRWIEQQYQPAPRSFSRPKRNQKPRLPLGPVRSAVSKEPAQKQNRQRRKLDTRRILENTAVGLNTPRSNASQTPDVRKLKSRQIKESTPFHPFRPQRVSKAAKKKAKSMHTTDINANSQLIGDPDRRSQRHSTARAQGKREKVIQEHPPTYIKTRSGRKSKRPERLGFVPYG